MANWVAASSSFCSAKWPRSRDTPRRRSLLRSAVARPATAFSGRSSARCRASIPIDPSAIRTAGRLSDRSDLSAGRRSLSSARKRPAPSSSIRRTSFSIWCGRAARACATASASAVRASPGPACTRSRRRRNGRTGRRRRRCCSASRTCRISWPGGPNNPLGARAMYLGSTLYRIHGSNEPWTIGQNVSSGCIRMRNADVIDLYEPRQGRRQGGGAVARSFQARVPRRDPEIQHHRAFGSGFRVRDADAKRRQFNYGSRRRRRNRRRQSRVADRPPRVAA